MVNHEKFKQAIELLKEVAMEVDMVGRVNIDNIHIRMVCPEDAKRRDLPPVHVEMYRVYNWGVCTRTLEVRVVNDKVGA